jgi:sensor histidine kinase YesM
MVVLALPLLFSPETLTLRAYLTNPPTQRDLLFNALLIAVFYINYYGLIPKFYFGRRYFLFLIVNIGSFFAINYFSSFPNAPFPPGSPSPFAHQSPPPASDQSPSRDPHQVPPPGPHHSFFMDISQHLFTLLVVIFLALLLKIRERLKQAEREKLQAELSYLRAQINPHFLFNILNGIYALTIERSDKAPDAVIKLSEMMRYILDESGKEMVSLEKELDYIRNYIALQESRFGPTIRLDYHIDGIARSTASPSAPASPLKIAPLILIPGKVHHDLSRLVHRQGNAYSRRGLYQLRSEMHYPDRLSRQHYQGSK